MMGKKNGPGKEEKAGNVEKLTDEKLDKVSGGFCGPFPLDVKPGENATKKSDRCPQR